MERGKRTAKLSAAAAILLIVAAAVFLVVGPERMPTFAQLAEASEEAAARIDSLRFVGRDSERGKPLNYEAFVRNPHFLRKQYPDGSYSATDGDRTLLYDKETNKCAFIEAGRGIGLPVTHLFTRHVILNMLNAEDSASEVKIEETELNAEPVYKATFSLTEGEDVLHFEVHFDKATGLLMKMDVDTEEGWMGGEVVEINPGLDDSLFSTEPPAGATVVPFEEFEWGRK